MAKVARERAENVALWGLIMQLLFAGASLLIARWNRSLANQVEGWHLLLGVLFWGVALLQLRARRRAEEEAAEMERVEAARRAGRDQALFAPDDEHAFIARTRLRQLERYFVPAFSAIIGLLLSGLATFLIWRMWQAGRPAEIREATISLALMAGMAFFCFLTSKYAAGMARQPEWRLLRAGASYMMSCAGGSFAVAVGLAFAYFQLPAADKYIAYVIAVAFGFVGIEILLNFILDFYRPRAEGEEQRPAYDSRMLGLLTEPVGIMKTVAATLDYQFGFKISQTWFYRFLERAIAPVILFQLIAFYMLTCLTIVGPEEQAIIERFGRPRAGHRALGPGLHIKWPWPIEKAYRYPAQRILTISRGYKKEKDSAQETEKSKQADKDKKKEEKAKEEEKKKKPKEVLWDVEHFEEEYTILVAMRVDEEFGLLTPTPEEGKRRAPPLNLLSAEVQVQYRVKDGGLYDYLYNHAEPDKLLEALAYRELIRYMASVDMFDVMGPRRHEASLELQNRIQQIADAEKLGVEIVFIGLQGVHPPVKEEVGKAFQQVISAQQQKEATILAAEGEANELEAKTEYDSRMELTDARADRYERITLARGEAERFKAQMKLDECASEVYRQRELLSAMEEALGKVRKYVVAAKGILNQRMILDLKDVVRPEMWQIGFQEPTPPEEGKKE